MSLFPDILPAHPASAESITHEKRKLKYGFIGRIILALDMAKERRELSRLDDRLLQDIGLSRAETRIEAIRSRWNVPSNWTTKYNWRADIEHCLSNPGLR